MSVTVKNIHVFKDINKDLSEIIPRLLLKLGGIEILRIRQRTALGKDVNEKQFVPYSQSYAKFRREMGRRITPVNLTLTGKMLGSMIPRPTKTGVDIVFGRSTEQQKAIWHNFGRGARRALGESLKAKRALQKTGIRFLSVPKREFFAISEKDASYIEKYVGDALNEL